MCEFNTLEMQDQALEMLETGTLRWQRIQMGGGGITYHYLSMPIRERSCRVTSDGVLAVSEPTSEGILHL